MAIEKAPPGRLLVLDGVKRKMLVFNTEGALLKTLVEDTGGTPAGIAVDSVQRQIYWTNMGEHWDQKDGFIERIDFDGSNRTMIIPKGGTTTPTQLILDLGNKHIYWCDREGMRVMRSGMDGSRIFTLVITGQGEEDQKDETKHCVGIAIDYGRSQIFWTQKGAPNSGTGRILRAGIEPPPGENPANRTDIEIVLDGLPEPIDLEFDSYEDWLYWTARGNPPNGNSLNRMLVDERHHRAGKPEMLTGGLKEGIGLTLDHKKKRAFMTDMGGGIYCHDGKEFKLLYAGKDGQGFRGIAYVEQM